MCSGYPNDPNNPDKECWAVLGYIEEKYSNIDIINNIAWSQEELLTLNASLFYMSRTHGGPASFANAMGETRVQNSPLISGGLSLPSGLVIVGDNAFTTNDPDEFNPYIYELIIHEFGHRFDFNNSKGNPSLYKSQTMVDILSSDCDLDTVGCLGNTPEDIYSPVCNLGMLGCLGNDPSVLYTLVDAITGGIGPGCYNPTNTNTTDYALRQGSIEDFADSYAYHVLSLNNLPIPRYHRRIQDSVERKSIIETWINLTK